MINHYNKTILITGATGFIGNYLINELLTHNYNILATSRLNEQKINTEWINNTDYIQANLNEKKEDWFSFFGKPDMIIHLAWEGLPNYNELFHIEQNLSNNYYFLKNMIEKGLKNIIVSGTCFEYGDQSGELSEEIETKPNTTYGLAKDCLRKFLEQLQVKFDFDLKWIRIFYPYGEGQNPNSILSQLDLALEKGDKVFNMSGGEQIRDYLRVEKMVEYIVKISMQDKINGIINCCSGNPISIKDLVKNYLIEKDRTIELNLGYFPYENNVPMAFWGSIKKIKSILGNQSI